MCFVDLEKAFDMVQRKMLEWAMRRNEKPEVLVRSVMSLYEGAKIRARVDSELSEEFEINVGMHVSMESTFLFALVLDVVTEFASESVPSELLYADDFVHMCEVINGLRNRFLKLKRLFRAKVGKLTLGKTR